MIAAGEHARSDDGEPIMDWSADLLALAATPRASRESSC